MQSNKVPANLRWDVIYREVRKTTNGLELCYGNALFWNRGQLNCLIDGKIPLKPGESIEIGVNGGGAVVKSHQFEFFPTQVANTGGAGLVAADDTTLLPIDGIFVVAKECITIQMTLKKYYGNA